MKSNQDILPPKSADRFFKWYCNDALFDSIYGDLYERFLENIEANGEKKAKRKYWVDVIRFMNKHTLKRSNKTSQFNSNNTAMFSNYFKVGFRNLIKNKSFTIINVLGLSVSMAVCLVIILMINDQMGYDNFQTNRDKIYRFTHERTNGNVGLPIATVPMPIGERIQSDYSGIKELVRFRRGLNGEILQNGKAISLVGYYTDPSFFDMFSFELEQGDKKTALVNPNSVVLRKDIAEKLFPGKNPIGETIELSENGTYLVTGVLEEFPGKTHIQFEALASMSSVSTLEKDGTLKSVQQNWQSTTASWVYFTLNDGADLGSVQSYLTDYENENYDETTEYIVEFNIQKMTDITPGPLYGNQIGSAMPNFFVYGLGILALLIIICAAFNYTNLSAARALTRTKEVGVRKVMGARKRQLTLQFIVESILVSMLSLVVAIGLLQFLIPAFEGLQMSSLLSWDLKMTGKAYLQFFVFSIGVGLITGLFPALYMSSFQPIQAMKSIISSNKLSKVSLRKALIVSQFVISLVLVVSSTLVFKQVKFMIEKDYGYAKENIINVQLQGQDFGILKTELQKLPFVNEISGTNNIPNTGMHYDIEVRRNSPDEPMDFNYFSVDESYIDNLELELIAGSNFIPGQGEGNEKAIIINETAVKDLGFDSPINAVGETVTLMDSTIVSISGVVKDYNYMVLYMEINPLVLRYRSDEFNYAQVKLSGFDISGEIQQIENVWEEFDPNHEFQFNTFQGQIDEFNAFFFDIIYIIGLISFLSISIAGMGLLGIATYSIQIRLKEVSVRKVLGASVKGLILLLSKGFLKLFAIAMVIGFSLAYLGNSAWLNGFAYRVNFGIGIFLIAASAMVIIGISTIGLQAYRATSNNPADALRDD
jgi:putative ABC transport system permease protein